MLTNESMPNESMPNGPMRRTRAGLRRAAWSKWLVPVTALLLIGAVIAGYLTVTRQTARTVAYCAQLHDGVGLFEGNPVTRRGVRIGTVEKIDTTGGTARVTFSVDENESIPADVRAATVAPSILAVRQLALLGDPAGGPSLAAGECIGLDRTSTPVSISKSLEAIGNVGHELTSAGGPEQLLSVMTSMNTLGDEFAGAGPVLNGLLKQLAKAPNTPLNAGLGDLAKTIDATSALSTGLAANWAMAKDLITTLTPLLESSLVPLFDGATRVMGALPETVTVLGDLMVRYQHFVWPALDVVVPIARLVGAGMRNFGDVLGIVPVLIKAFTISFDQDSLGLRIRYTPPRTRIPAQNPTSTCANINRIFPGQCHVSGPDGMEIDALRWVLLMTGAAR